MLHMVGPAYYIVRNYSCVQHDQIEHTRYHQAPSHYFPLQFDRLPSSNFSQRRIFRQHGIRTATGTVLYPTSHASTCGTIHISPRVYNRGSRAHARARSVRRTFLFLGHSGWKCSSDSSIQDEWSAKLCCR